MLRGFNQATTKIFYNILKHYFSEEQKWFDHPKTPDEDVQDPRSDEHYAFWHREQNKLRNEIHFVSQHTLYQSSKARLNTYIKQLPQKKMDAILHVYHDRYFPIVSLEYQRACDQDRNLQKIILAQGNITLNLKRRYIFKDRNDRFYIKSPNGVHIIVRAILSQNASTDADRVNTAQLITAYISHKRIDDRSVHPQTKKKDNNRTKNDLEEFLRHLRDVRLLHE